MPQNQRRKKQPVLVWTAMALLAGILASCSWAVDPERPPLENYEPPPIDHSPIRQGGGRV